MLKATLRIFVSAALALTSLTFTPVTHAEATHPARSRVAAPDISPCGPVTTFNPSEWLATTTLPGILGAVEQAASQENWQWRRDTNTLWRGDTRETVQQIFQTGFTPWGPKVTPLSEFIVNGGGQKDTAHVSAGCVHEVAQRFATYGAAKTGWVYEIHAPGGIDVNATALVDDYKSPYLWNKEIDFVGGIQGRFLRQACKYHLLSTDPVTRVNTYESLGCLTNPNFNPTLAAQPVLTGAR